MTEISRIDRELNAIYAELRKREKARPHSAANWQQAWDRHPELHRREIELFRERGVAQQERDAKAEKLWKQQKRQSRAKKCPTCGHRTLAA